MKEQQNETTRIAIAAAIIQGSAYRRRILRKLKTRYRAYAPEIGIDASRFLLRLHNMERRELSYKIVYVILILIAILSLGLGAYSIFLLSLALTVFVAIYKAYKDEFVIAKKVSAGRFSEALLEKEFPRLDAPKLDEVALNSMNVFVYKGFSPFYFFGQIVYSSIPRCRRHAQGRRMARSRNK